MYVSKMGQIYTCISGNFMPFVNTHTGAYKKHIYIYEIHLYIIICNIHCIVLKVLYSSIKRIGKLPSQCLLVFCLFLRLNSRID